MGRPDDQEARHRDAAILAARYTMVLDLVSRCAGSVESGNWAYLNQKAAELADKAGELAAAADTVAKQAPDTDPRTVLADVLQQGEFLHTVRALHFEFFQPGP